MRLRVRARVAAARTWYDRRGSGPMCQREASTSTSVQGPTRNVACRVDGGEDGFRGELVFRFPQVGHQERTRHGCVCGGGDGEGRKSWRRREGERVKHREMEVSGSHCHTLGTMGGGVDASMNHSGAGGGMERVSRHSWGKAA